MARYGVDCGNSYCMGGQTSNNFGEGDDDLLSIYSMLPPTEFTNMASFKKSIMERYEGFVVGSSVHHQYMAFMHITRKWFNKINALREGKTTLPKLIILYDAIEEVLIVKLMPNLLHDVASMQFHNILLEKFTQLSVNKRVFSVGGGRFGDVNARSKEADNAYRPVGRHGDDFPSLVVEVGLSESLEMLKNDAQYWLTKSGGQTRIVITLHIDKASRKIALQHWECVDHDRARRASDQYPPIPHAIQSLELKAGQQYVGDALEIPPVKVFDTVPNNLPNDEFIFTPAKLQDFCDFYWANV